MRKIGIEKKTSRIFSGAQTPIAAIFGLLKRRTCKHEYLRFSSSMIHLQIQTGCVFMTGTSITSLWSAVLANNQVHAMVTSLRGRPLHKRSRS
jgi:hypothetical protein